MIVLERLDGSESVPSDEVRLEPPPPTLSVLTEEERKAVIRNSLQYAEVTALKDYVNVVANRRANPEAYHKLINAYKLSVRVLEDLQAEFADPASLEDLPAWMRD